MEAEQPLILAVLPELMDADDDKKPNHEKPDCRYRGEVWVVILRI